MKWILVVLLAPIYCIIQIFKKLIEFIFKITEPFVEGISIIMDNMYNFWFKNKKGR